MARGRHTYNIHTICNRHRNYLTSSRFSENTFFLHYFAISQVWPSDLLEMCYTLVVTLVQVSCSTTPYNNNTTIPLYLTLTVTSWNLKKRERNLLKQQQNTLQTFTKVGFYLFFSLALFYPINGVQSECNGYIGHKGVGKQWALLHTSQNLCIFPPQCNIYVSYLFQIWTIGSNFELLRWIFSSDWFIEMSKLEL